MLQKPEENGEERVIYYASWSLTDAEKSYSQTEKEALGIVGACERLHMCLYGTGFEILIDHKPLDHLFVVVGYCSRYMEVEVSRSTIADKVIASLRKIFLTHGLPVSITTDNGPQSISKEFC